MYVCRDYSWNPVFIFYRLINKNITINIFSLWMQNDERMHSEMITCAMAFRILRMNGYAVSSGNVLFSI